MGEVTPFRRPINWEKLRADEAETVIRQRAAPENAENVFFTNHTWDRVSEREITREDLSDILSTGYCSDQPRRNERGNWQVIISKRMAGSREAGAVTVILEDEVTLIIRTVEWIN